MEISQRDFERLLEEIRDLSARVRHLEQLAGIFDRPSPDEPDSARAALKHPPSPPRAPDARALPSPQQAVVSPEAVDLESRIGSHWLNRVGIAAVLVGVSFFLNYAFENNWIGPAGRVAIGLVAGMLLVVWSERFRMRGYEIFSYTLKALAIGVLYLSLWASFQVYHLLPSGLVFAAMIIVTGVTEALAVVEDAEVLAVFAIAGGFATPVLLSTGENREIVLFAYLALLDLAILSLIIVKPWHRIAVLGFTGTLLLYISWYREFYDPAKLAPTLLFAALFFAIFAAAPLLLVRRQAHPAVPVGLAFANGVTFFFQGYAMLMGRSATAMAWFSLLLAGVYLAMVRARSGRSLPSGERSLRLTHLALAIGLVTVAIPIRLEGHAITIGWLVESVALLWLGGRTQSNVLDWFGLSALAMGVARLLFWDDFQPSQLIFNSRMASYGAAVGALGFAVFATGRKQTRISKRAAEIMLAALNVLALRALSLEVADYYAREIRAGNFWRPEIAFRRRGLLIARDFTYSALWMAYGAMLMAVGFWRGHAFVRWLALALIAVTTMKVFVYDTSQLDRIYRILSFIALGVLLLAISFAYQRNWIKLPSTEKPSTPPM
ncbi:MAG: DUF2339 domain-containing protein [Acidobacteria bacterium]|nr:DUF2339 domain-containing protein [Acidobacteriota bacterium]